MTTLFQLTIPWNKNAYWIAEWPDSPICDRCYSHDASGIRGHNGNVDGTSIFAGMRREIPLEEKEIDMTQENEWEILLACFD